MKLFFIIVAIFSTTEGLNVVTLQYCCGLGTKNANSGLKCEDIQTPITGVRKEDESSCIHSVEVCCNNQKKQLECEKGIQDANNEKQCIGTGLNKDCCDACLLGRETGKAQKACEERLGLGLPLDKAFTNCCNEILTSTTSTTTTTTAKSTSELTKSTAATNYLPLPPVQDGCDIGDICAQICIPTQDSYRCGCNKGFMLMADGISCKPDKRSTNKKSDSCTENNPCDHNCIDTGVAIKCSCREGYELAKDKRTCKDIDECAQGIHECGTNEECVNEEGSFFCDDPNFEPEADLNGDPLETKCPPGYKFNYDKLVCDDINECEFDIICTRPKVCINTIGSFKCEGEDAPQCPPGFQFKDSIQTCSDIDECITGANDCNKESQLCLNTKGNYTCVDKVSRKSCPPGFKKNVVTQNCDDINECEENEHACTENEDCVNEPGGHNCIPRDGSKKIYEYPLRPPYVPALPPKPTNPVLEPSKTSPTTASTSTTSTSTSTSTTSKTTTSTTTTKATTSKARPQESCPTGYKFSPQHKRCFDIDECDEDPHLCDSNQDCYNSPGSYICNCKAGFTKDYHTGACIDINECQVGRHDCTDAQRCDNTIGSYLCARITGCGTGYTLNYANGLCEDDDECTLNTHTCRSLGVNFKCRNTLGSYRCDVERPKQSRPLPPLPPPPVIPIIPTPLRPSVQPTRQSYPILSGSRKQCLPGYIMSEKGVCEDINECLNNPCRKGQKCLNFNGRYQCLSTVQCTIGYEFDEATESCVDINECIRNTHKCKPSQICKNGRGFYTCECPPGHHMDPKSQQCVDIDECKYYRACSVNAQCINTVGSYKCYCKEGFREERNVCEDIDECKENSRLCEHSCVNIWGSYRCACKSGFILNHDNRTCTDIDECEKFKDKRLCIGTCKNVPGSYKCECPKGYRLGSDSRTCIDIDECQQNVCPNPNDICLNTRGGYKCYPINCPSNYFRDPQHKGRCKRPPTLCDTRDLQCILMPEQYTYHYITLVSDLPISSDVQLFQINGPKWVVAKAEFSMKIVDVKSPYGVEKVTERFFKMIKPSHNTMQLFLVRPITGPQEIELKIEMQLYQSNVMTANVVSYIFIVVSEFPF